MSNEPILIIIEGEPVAKGRPKFARRGSFVTTYTPEKTRTYEQLVAEEAAKSMRGRTPISGPVILRLDLNIAVPASYSNKRRASCLAGLERPTKKPDWENCAKSVCDAFNGIVWLDDSQVVEATVVKRWAEEGSVVAIIREETLGLDLASPSP